MSEQSKPIIVLSYNWSDYLRFLQESMEPKNSKKYVCGDFPYIHGTEASGIIETPMFGRRSDADEVRLYAKTRVR